MRGIIIRFDRLMRNATGATVLEYAFIAGLISIAAVALWTEIGGWAAGVFGTLTDTW